MTIAIMTTSPIEKKDAEIMAEEIIKLIQINKTIKK